MDRDVIARKLEQLRHHAARIESKKPFRAEDLAANTEASTMRYPIEVFWSGEDVNYSGKFLMRVPKRLHAELAHAAKAQGVSLNQCLLYMLTKGHGERTRRAA